jgi:adenine-specific DNA-methyltransferase
LLCDQVFGEDNFVANIVNNVGGGKNNTHGIATKHEYVVVYRKSVATKLTGKQQITTKDVLSELRKTGDNDKREDRPTMFFPIYYNNDKLSLEYTSGAIEITPKRPNGTDSRWRWSRGTVKDNIGSLIYKTSSNKIYVKEPAGKEKEIPHSTIINFPTTSGTNELIDIFGDKVFDYPKPTELIKFLLRLNNNNNATILDFFAGSGTTAQAVIELNKEDGGNRQCILITNNENKICEEITYHRIKKVIQGYTKQNGEKIEGHEAKLHYFKIGFEKASKNNLELQNTLVSHDGYGSLVSIKENAFDKRHESRGYEILVADDGHIVVIVDSSAKNFNELIELLKEKDEVKKVIYLRDLEDDNFQDLEDAFKNVKNVEFRSMLKEVVNNYTIAQRHALIDK